ncbi:hypothetical protein GO986_15605 [Deinococcus sp. HMF7620]|uniref:Type 4 fimbrial biogenesis protein PilX N-terminal domain-containing protein n=1 Tax=Deinococcus arboris TaxID=2682977 RepID=A0A7C9I0V2_9DEIO|nr:hypothetical protein [Deinococcus arboris]MVN88175.1 hypothetical protein [Deinococcus arboris]
MIPDSPVRSVAAPDRQQGFSLVLALSLVALLSIMLITYSLLTVNNARTSSATSRGSAGFYAAEAALNARADNIRTLFKSFRTPGGESPLPAGACVGANQGSEDMKCEETTIAGRKVQSYVQQSEDPYSIVVASGERFAGLTGEETPYTVRSQALNAAGNPEALANMTFRSRVVPLFQFAVFFDKDMEFDNTAKLSFTGPIHSNGNIFLDSGTGTDTSLTLEGQVTSAYDIYRRQKKDNICQGSVLIAAQDTSMVALPCSSAVDTPYTNDYYKTRYGGTVESNIGELDVPSIAALQPTPSAEYWQKADVRIVLKRKTAVSSTFTSANYDDFEPYFVSSTGQRLNVNCVDTAPNPVAKLLTPPQVAVSYSATFRDTREARYWDNSAQGNNPARSTKIMLDVNVRKLLSCIENSTNSSVLGVSGGLQNATEGGLVIYMTVDDRGAANSTVTSSLLAVPLTNGSNGAIAQSDAPVANNYGVRLWNADVLKAESGARPKGVTFVTDQAAYVQGDFNKALPSSVDWVPSAVLADSFNIVSEAWEEPATFWLSTTCVTLTRATAIVPPVVTAPTTCPATSAAAAAVTTAVSRTLYSDAVNIDGLTYYVYSTQGVADRKAGAGLLNNNTGLTSTLIPSMPLANTGNNIRVEGDLLSKMPLTYRQASETTVNTAILAGTATTVAERKIYDNLSSDLQSGGVHNMMRFHEEWGANGGNAKGIQKYNYRGSLVSLDQPQHAKGSFQVNTTTYNPPLRQWKFEENFRQSSKLPPLTPRFVYIKQENFTRDFAQ